MEKKITNLEVQEFLNDFEKNSETIILEEGSKEKNELEKIAEARGIKIKGSRDLAIFKTIYAFTDQPNSNGAILPKKELLRVLPQIVGKPVNKNHNRTYVMGSYIDYRYKQKENKIIAYQTFFKSNFPEEFEKAQKLLKKKKLSSSFEIWSPKDKRKYREDGSFEMYQMEIAGGALIYEDKDNEPAFKNAKVLAIAKDNKELQLELVYASKHKEDEIITCKDGECRLIKANENKEDTTITPTISKVKCSNCGEEFDSGVIEKIKCPKCFAILDKSGNMIYPPQIKDFKMLCPGCSTNNWLILSKKEDRVKVQCLGCSKEYNLTFATEQKRDIIDKINFVYSSRVSCLQCHKPIYVLGTSSTKTKNVKCKKCGLEFSYDITHDRYKKISKIEEVIPKENKIDKTKESSEEGGQKMAKEKKVEKASEKKVEVKVENKKIDAKIVAPKKEVKEEKKLAKEHNFLEATEKENKEEISKRLENAKVEEPKKVETEIGKKSDNMVKEFAEAFGKLVEKNMKKTAEPKEKIKEEAKEKPETKKIAKETPKAEDPKVEPKKEVKIEATKKETSKEEKLAEARFEYEVESLDEILEDVKPAEIEESARLTTEQRNALPDSMFAVVVKVKDKKTGKTRKIRKYPINDEAHVRNALARLGQPKAKATLKKLGISVEAVKAKILRRARQLKMTQLLERYKAGIRKVANKVKELRKEKASLEKKVELYKTKAKTILERQVELGEGCELTEEEILNDDKFGKAKAEKELAKANAELNKGNDIVGSKLTHDEKWYADQREKIDKKAFGHINKNIKK